MDLINRLYEALVNRVPGIRYRYRCWQCDHSGAAKLMGWGYLIWLNMRYHVFRQRALEYLPVQDTGRKVPLSDCPESDNGFSTAPEELARRLLEADVISFDVFDTLILRPFRDPTDLFFELARRLGYPGLKELRILAEELARKGKSDTAEVTLEEIWAQLERLSGVPAAEGLEAEWQAELDCCMANPYFLKVLPLLRQQNARVIICSDMYLGEKRIRQLLERCGLGTFEAYFISGDLGISKSDGQLFPRVREILGAGLRYIHVGDNPYSDCKQAQRAGFRTVHYPNVNILGWKMRCDGQSPLVGSAYAGIVNSQLYNGTIRRSKAYELGFVYGGLLVTGFCQFIHDHAKRENLDRLLFLARDGQVLHRAYRMLYPSEEERCVYVLWSRLAAVRLGAGRFRHQFERYMIRNKVDAGYTLEQVMDTMLLSDLLPGFLEQSGVESAKVLLTRDTADWLWAYLEAHWEQVLERYLPELEEGRRYYEQALNGAKRAAAIDVGWVGSGPLTLRWLIEQQWKLDCRVSCVLAGTVGAGGTDSQAAEAELSMGSMVSYLYSSAHNRELWRAHDLALGHNMLVELLLSATTPSFRGFFRRSDGGYAFNDDMEAIDAAQVQAGVMDFVACYAAHPWSGMRISGSDAMAPIRLLCQNPAWVRDLIEESKIRANVE